MPRRQPADYRWNFGGLEVGSAATTTRRSRVRTGSSIPPLWTGSGGTFHRAGACCLGSASLLIRREPWQLGLTPVFCSVATRTPTLVVERVSRANGRVDVALKQIAGASISRVQALTDPSSSYRIEAGGAVAVVRGTTFALIG